MPALLVLWIGSPWSGTPLSGIPSSGTPASSNPASSNLASVSPASVSAALEPYIKELNRPVYAFHCASRQRIGLPRSGVVAVDHSAVRPFLESKIERYWNLATANREDALLSGLYAGLDPVSCLSFAGSGGVWSIVQIELRTSFRFLDLRRSDEDRGQQQRLPPAVVSRLAELGCEADFTFALLTVEPSQACREIAHAALAELKVDGVLINFPRSRLAGCAWSEDGVFVLLDPEIVAGGSVKVFTPDAGDDDGATLDRQRIRSLFLRARQAGSLRPAPWPEIDVAPLAETLDAWIQDHLLGCGSHPEDRISPPALEQSWRSRALEPVDRLAGSNPPDGGRL